MDREYSGEGGKLILSDSGVLYGSGWDLTYAYGVEYSEEKAKAADPVMIAANVISAAAGYNYALYVTGDGKLHFIGDSGIPFKERFSFDGRIKEVFAKPDRNEFRLIDENGVSYAWGDNQSAGIFPLKQTIRAVVNDQIVTLKDGYLIWAYKQDGEERRCAGTLMNYPSSEKRGLVRMRLRYTKLLKDLCREYGPENLLYKYVLRSKSELRELVSPNWSPREYEKLNVCDLPHPHGPGITDIRHEAYWGVEKDYTYSVGIYSINYIIYNPIKIDAQETNDGTAEAEVQQ